MLDLSGYTVRMADGPRDLHDVQRLRYQVFVEELQGDGPLVDHEAGLEIDGCDGFADHLLLEDQTQPEGARIIGAYRLMNAGQAENAGGFSSAAEYDLEPLLKCGRKLLELSRSCVHPDHRGGPALLLLWQALATHVAQTKSEVLFGVASFHGTDPTAWMHALGLLHQRYLAPADLRPVAKGAGAYAMDKVPADQMDAKRGARELPSLVKTYVRLGGKVGQGACVDHAFNTTDVCMIVDVDKIPPRERTIYQSATA